MCPEGNGGFLQQKWSFYEAACGVCKSKTAVEVWTGELDLWQKHCYISAETDGGSSVVFYT